jgi:serine/threonine protein kinase
MNNPAMPSPQEREAALFALAVEKPITERAAFLQAVCGKDSVLRQRLEALLAAHEAPAGVLVHEPAREVMAPTLVLPEPLADETVGMTLGRYKLREKLGEGGCGTVYVAEQTEPVRRKVALKVIKLGMDTREVIARFEAERQALAMMDHPNIAKVLDAGATEAGRPYFVMELVRGIRITDYCDQASLSTKERLNLFIKVCHAIQHAHQKGIIHRDIKPSNILVTLHDGVPVPKVIDFGIAKATEGRLTDATVYTQLHQFMGTPAYMSPEQAEMSGLDVDTRSDIYSLGVLLYQLLTSKTPFDAKELLSMGLDAMRKTIREKEPMRPSTRLAALQGEELTTTAKRRSADAPKLIHLLKGDLDWIVMKALEKDRTRRYDTANGLAMDVQRHLVDEPVTARAPSAGYKFRKFARRNRVALVVSAAIAFLASALLGSILLLVKEFQAGKYGGITVHNNPEGAEVWRGGQRVGTTPFERTGVPIGEFTYSLIMNNHESVTNTTSLAPKKHMNDFTFLRRIEPPGTGTVANLKTNLTEMTATASQGIIVIAMQGRVEVTRKGAAGWTLVQTNMTISAGDSLRTGPRSRATLRWPNERVVRINELTSMEISQPATNKLDTPPLRLNDGKIYFFNRDGTSNSFRFTTPEATASIRG